MAAVFLIIAGAYLGCGLGLAAPLAWFGVNRIDPHAKGGSWGFRLLILPGTTVLWPWLLHRWLKGVQEPPEENTAHRRAAAKRTS